MLSPFYSQIRETFCADLFFLPSIERFKLSAEIIISKTSSLGEADRFSIIAIFFCDMLVIFPSSAWVNPLSIRVCLRIAKSCLVDRM